MADDRHNVWQLGLALGLAVDAALLLAAGLNGWVLTAANAGNWLAVGISIVALGWTGLPVAVAAWGAFWAVRQTREAWARRNDVVPGQDPSEPDDDDGETGEIAPDDELERIERARQHQIAHWQVFFRRLFAAACAYGWDIRTLTGKDRKTRVMSQPAWNIGTDCLAEAGVIVKGPGIGATLSPDVTETSWNLLKMWERIPCPKGEPPEILPPPYTPQQTTAKTTANTAQRVIDGEFQKG